MNNPIESPKVYSTTGPYITEKIIRNGQQQFVVKELAVQLDGKKINFSEERGFETFRYTRFNPLPISTRSSAEEARRLLKETSGHAFSLHQKEPNGEEWGTFFEVYLHATGTFYELYPQNEDHVVFNAEKQKRNLS